MIKYNKIRQDKGAIMVKVGEQKRALIKAIEDGVEYTIEVQGTVVHVSGNQVVRPEKPPLFGQRWEAWGPRKYSKKSHYTFAQAGCLITCVAMLAKWAGYDTNPLDAAQQLDAVGGFSGPPYSGHMIAEKVPLVFPKLQWNRFGSRYDWPLTPADVGLLARLLEKHPVIVQVDFDPRDKDVDSHFMLAYKYVPASGTTGPVDELYVADPWTGEYVLASGNKSLGGYFNPAWRLNGITRVQRLVTAMRVFHIDDNKGT